VYAAGKLLLAYGLEILFTLIIVSIGVGIFLANGASFGNSLSSVLRSAGGAILAAPIQDRYLNAKDPLPDHLAKATIMFQHSRLTANEQSIGHGTLQAVAMKTLSSAANSITPAAASSTEDLLKPSTRLEAESKRSSFVDVSQLERR
jgi:hypothetical protein